VHLRGVVLRLFGQIEQRVVDMLEHAVDQHLQTLAGNVPDVMQQRASALAGRIQTLAQTDYV
jgi:hypothetical protein